MQETLITQGFNLMLYGMGTVFVFLAVLVVMTTLMSKVVMRVAPPVEQDTAPPVSNAASIDPKVLKAIEEAIRLHRKK